MNPHVKVITLAATLRPASPTEKPDANDSQHPESTPTKSSPYHQNTLHKHTEPIELGAVQLETPELPKSCIRMNVKESLQLPANSNIVLQKNHQNLAPCWNGATIRWALLVFCHRGNEGTAGRNDWPAGPTGPPKLSSQIRRTGVSILRGESGKSCIVSPVYPLISHRLKQDARQRRIQNRPASMVAMVRQ